MPHQPAPASYVPTVTGGAAFAAPAPGAGASVIPGPRLPLPEPERTLRQLHQRWVTVVDGCLETELECGDGEPVDTLRTAWARALEHSGDIKALLDAYIGDPVHDQLTERHLLRLAQAAGMLRPGHTPREGLEEVERVLATVAPARVDKPGWFARQWRHVEEDRLVRAARGGW